MVFTTALVGQETRREDDTAVCGRDGEVLPDEQTASECCLYKLLLLLLLGSAGVSDEGTGLKVVRGVGVLVCVWSVLRAEGEGEEGELGRGGEWGGGGGDDEARGHVEWWRQRFRRDANKWKMKNGKTQPTRLGFCPQACPAPRIYQSDCKCGAVEWINNKSNAYAVYYLPSASSLSITFWSSLIRMTVRWGNASVGTVCAVTRAGCAIYGLSWTPCNKK